MDFVSGFSQAFRRIAGSRAPGSTAGGSNPVATIDAVKAAPAPSPLKPIETSPMSTKSTRFSTSPPVLATSSWPAA